MKLRSHFNLAIKTYEERVVFDFQILCNIKHKIMNF